MRKLFRLTVATLALVLTLARAASATPPATCTAGQGYWDYTSSTVVFYLCTATNTWTSVSAVAGTATTLATPRAINGVNFDGSAAITVTAAAGTLSGASLASGVTASSLTSFGAAAAFTTSGAIQASGTTPIGYATGAGGTVSQSSTKATGVTLSKLTGTITMNAAALASATIVSFTVTNTLVTATDVVHVQHDSGGTVGAYTVMPNTMAAGSFVITVRNNTAGSLSEALVLRFVVVKGAVS